MKIRKAVIAAAGLGTRFLPITKTQPKEMLPLLNKPLIQYAIEEVIACGVELVVMITAAGKRSMEDYFDRHFELERLLEEKGEDRLVAEMRNLSNATDICYVRQKEQLGLGHALFTARRIIGDEPFILVLPDDIFERRGEVLQQMIDVHQRYDSDVVAVKRISGAEISRYGIVEVHQVRDRIYRITRLVEKPASDNTPSDLAIMGRYVLTPEIFEVLNHTQPGRNKEIQLTDALNSLCQRHPVYGYEFDGERYDAGTLAGWLETNIALALHDPEIGPELREHLANRLAQAYSDNAVKIDSGVYAQALH